VPALFRNLQMRCFTCKGRDVHHTSYQKSYFPYHNLTT